MTWYVTPEETLKQYKQVVNQNKPEQVLEKPNTESKETGGTSEITGVGLSSIGDVTSSVV